MGTGFLGRPSRRGRPWKTRHHGSKEAVVARREHTRSTTLEVRITFEPSRVSPACVAQAYERVVPITRRTTPQALPPWPDENVQQTQPVGRRQAS